MDDPILEEVSGTDSPFLDTRPSEFGYSSDSIKALREVPNVDVALVHFTDSVDPLFGEGGLAVGAPTHEPTEVAVESASRPSITVFVIESSG